MGKAKRLSPGRAGVGIRQSVGIFKEGQFFGGTGVWARREWPEDRREATLFVREHIWFRTAKP